MKRTIALLPWCLFLVLFLAGPLACNRSTVEGGGGTKLTLKKPADQTLVRGKTNDLRVEIARGNFDGPVAVEVDQLPKGVHVVATDDTSIPREEVAVNLTLHADPTADLVTNHRATVTAKAPSGIEATEVFQVTVKQ